MHQRLTLPPPLSRATRLGWTAGLVLLAAALLLGGATREGFALHAAVEIVGLMVIVLTVWRSPPLWRSKTRYPLLLLAATLALPLVQLIPTPPAFWSQLPGRAVFAEGFRAAGMALPWLPISLAPDATLKAGLSLIPAAAMFLATLAMDTPQRRALAPWILAVAAASILLGIGQVAGGPASALRFYEVTNTVEAVGFFSNRNHQAALLVAVLPLAAFWALAWAQRGGRWLLVGLGVALALVFATGVGVSQSRAGVVLLAVAGVGCLLMALRAADFGASRRALILVAGLLALGAAPAVGFGLTDILGELPASMTADPRFTAFPVVLRAAVDNLPLGTGLGAFEAVYRMLETPRTVTNAFLNHAHDDYLEIALETGLAGLALIALFLIWFFRSAYEAWRGPPASQTAGLARAASLSILMLLVHSAVDYPLRTIALSTLFAFLCGCMIAPSRPRRAHRGEPVAEARP